MLDWITGPDGKLLLAGAIGGAVAALTQPSTIMAAVRQVLIGSACAVYLSPVAKPVIQIAFGALNIDASKADNLAGFVMGATGLVIVETIVAAAKLRRRQIKGENNE